MPNKPFLEDMLTIGTGMLSNLAERRHELKTQAKQRIGSVARGFDLATREEFDAMFEMVAKARDMQEDLAMRLAKIEAHLNLSSIKKTVNAKNSSLHSVKTSKSRRVKK